MLDQAKAIPERDYNKIEYHIRKGNKQLERLTSPGVTGFAVFQVGPPL